MKNSYHDHFKKKKNLKKSGVPSQTRDLQLPKAKKKPSKRDKGVEDQLKKMLNIKSKARKKRDFSPSLVLFLFIGTVFAGWGVYEPEQILRLFNGIDIQWVSKVGAEVKPDKENNPQTKEDNVEKDSQSEGSSGKQEKLSVKNWTDEELSHFSKLNDRKLELDKREKELSKLEEELHKQKIEIENRIKRLEQLRTKISTVLKEKVDIDQKKVEKLVSFYSNMKPSNAAKIIGSLNEDLAVEVLSRMKKKSAAEILNLLKPDKAQLLSEKFAGYQY